MSTLVAARPICTVQICGGLGNQLFQYAAGRAIALRTGSQLKLDLSFYDKRRHRSFELDQFPIVAEFVLPSGGFRTARRCHSFLQKTLRRTTTYREPHYQYDPEFESLEAPVALEGYFQSERYFADYAESIRVELAIGKPDDESTLAWAERISGELSTAMHIRRGDYITCPSASQVFAQCSIDYYVRAMEQIPGNGPVYVFSDDVAWAKANLPAVKPLVFPSEDGSRSGLSDMWLMTQAHHHVIANSSFSWWAAWLAGPEKGMTIAPKQWFVDPAVDDRDLIPDRWIRL